jgi:hypothetical protein
VDAPAILADHRRAQEGQVAIDRLFGEVAKAFASNARSSRSRRWNTWTNSTSTWPNFSRMGVSARARAWSSAARTRSPAPERASARPRPRAEAPVSSHHRGSSQRPSASRARRTRRRLWLSPITA